MNPFPGAYSYWTSSSGVKTEVANPPEGDEWYQQDGDGDGFNNAQEAQFGSDPYRLDSDFDGLPDSVEFQYCMGATSALPYDPWNWDSNGNGFSDFDDFYQQIQGYNPVVHYNWLSPGSYFSYSDADGDGIKNFEDSDPLNCDRDGDNILNWNEAAGQMDDPYNGAGPPNSDPPPQTDPGVIIGGTWYPTGTMDSDGDGTPDHLDSFPYGSFWYQGIEYGGTSSDRDQDGIPDPADPFPDGSYWYNAAEYAAPWVDQDGDGIPDGLDPWPTIAGSYFYNGTQYSGVMSDQDGDGTPDSFDPTPNGEAPPINQDPWNGQPHYSYGGVEYAGSWSDMDNDGIPDAQDVSPNGSYWYGGTEYLGAWADRDGDGIPDDLDALPDDKWNGTPHFTYQGVEYSGSETDDRDGDGIPDAADAYPDDRTNRADSDSDGLSDYDETTQYGTDPAKADTDDDRLNDSDELFRYHTNPLLAKSNPDQPFSDFYTVNQADDDSDGIPNGIEQWYADQGFGMNPADPADASGDLDGDGYTNLQAWQNGWSLTSHTSTYDYDQDGILDVLEDAWNAAYPGMFDNHNFNDSVEDFDGDGVMNFEEIALGLNPGKASSRQATVSDVQEWAWRGLVVGSPAGLSYAGAGLNSSVQPEWQVMADANLDGVPDGLLAFVTALNADTTLVTLPQRVASGDYDGDGMLDYWEHTYNLDLRSAADAQANPDGDTLINSLEYAHGRNPLVSDDPLPEDPPSPLQVTTTSLPDGTVNSGYYFSIQYSNSMGGICQFSLSGSLPDGLFLNTDGSIVGTPTTQMSSTFTVQVTNESGQSASQILTLNVLPDTTTGAGDGTGGMGGTGENGGNNPPPPLVITTTDAQMRAIIYRPFSVTLAASGGGSDSINYNYSGDSGTLPAGLEFSANTNTIHGTPTVTGSYSFTLTVINNGVTDGSASVSKDFTLTVHDPLAFVSEEQLPGAVRDSSYLSGFEMSGGYGPCQFSLTSGELPPGLMLAANGQITGTPSVCGSYTFSVHVTDTFGGSLDKTFTLSVGEPPQPLAITTYSLPSGGVGIGYSAGIGVSGGNGDYTFTGEGGIFSVSSSGSISGFPTEPGAYAVSVTVTDSAQNTASASYVISIEAPALAVTSGDKQILKVGDTPEPVTVSVTGGGVGLAGVPVSMGSQSTTTDEGGSATFLPSALMTEGAHDFAVNAAGCGATVQMFAYTLPAGAGGTAPDILPGPPDDPPVTPVEDDDVIFESRSVSFTTGTLQAHYSSGMGVAYINGQFQVHFSGAINCPDYSSSKTRWTTSDGRSGEGTPPSLESLPWRQGLAGGYDQKFPDTNEGPVDGPDLPGGEGGGAIWPDLGNAPFKIIYNGGYNGKSVGRQKHTTSQVRMRRKTVNEGGSGGTEAITKSFADETKEQDENGVEKRVTASMENIILSDEQNESTPKNIDPSALIVGEAKVESLQKVKIEFLRYNFSWEDKQGDGSPTPKMTSWRRWFVEKSDPTGFETFATKILRVATWERGVLDQRNAFLNKFRPENIKDDTDAFYIRISGKTLPSTGDKLRVKISTDSDGEDYDDKGAEVELTLVPGKTDVYQSMALCLVSNAADDELTCGTTSAPINDGDLNDPTYKIALDGKLTAQIVINGIANGDKATADVKTERTLNVKAYILKKGAGNTAIPVIADPGVVTSYFKTAQERFVQMGIKLIPEVVTVDANPTGVEFGDDEGVFNNPSLADGALFYTLPNDTKALFSLNQADVVECYFVSNFANANTLAYSVVPRALAPADAAHAYQVVLNAPAIGTDTLAHELLHIVTNGIHAAPYDDFINDTDVVRSLWYSGQSSAPSVFYRTRISDLILRNAFTCPLLKTVP